MSRRSPGRKAQLEREKAAHPNSRTRGELRDLLRLSESTMDRAIKDGRIPPAAYHSVSGWPLWSAQQVRTLLLRRMERGRL